MVEKLTQKVQTESSMSFMELCDSISRLIAKVQQIWQDMGWYFNVGVGTVAAACVVALAMPVAFTAIEKKNVWHSFYNHTMAFYVCVYANVHHRRARLFRLSSEQ